MSLNDSMYMDEVIGRCNKELSLFTANKTFLNDQSRMNILICGIGFNEKIFKHRVLTPFLHSMREETSFSFISPLEIVNDDRAFIRCYTFENYLSFHRTGLPYFEKSQAGVVLNNDSKVFLGKSEDFLTWSLMSRRYVDVH